MSQTPDWCMSVMGGQDLFSESNLLALLSESGDPLALFSESDPLTHLTKQRFDSYVFLCDYE